MKPIETTHNGILWQYFIIGILALCCYINTFFGTFVFDDTEAIVKNKDVLPSTPLINIFKNDFWGTGIALNLSHKSYRPLAILSYRFNVLFANSELNPVHFHITNVILYVILCLVALPVLQLLLRTKTNKTDDTAFLSCLLFVVHPVHSEVVAGIVGRADILASLLFLVSFLLFNLVVKQRSHSYLFLVVIVILAATLCKETAITALAVCCVHDFLCSKIWKSDLSWNVIKQSAFLYRTLVLAISGLFMLYFRFKIMNFEGPNFTAADNPAAFATDIFTRILTYNYIYLLNFILLLWPQWLCFDWSMGCIPLIENTCDVRIVFLVIFWSFLLFAIFKFVQRIIKYKIRHMYSIIMALSFILFPFLPGSNLFLKVGFVIAERILLLPSLGFSFLIVLGFKKLTDRFKDKKYMFNIIFYCFCVTFALRTIQRNIDWLTEENLFNSALEICPLNAKVHYNVAKVAADNNKKALAVEEYEKAIELNPLYEQAMNNLANLLREDKRFKEAEVLLRKALEIRPNFAAAWMNLGIVLTNLNQSEEAEHCYLTAITFRKRYPDCYYNLGNLYLDVKRNEEALKAWEKAVSFRPTHTAAWSNMLVLLDSLKQYDEVLELGKTALMHNPMSAALHFSIANTLGKVQQFEKAEKHFLEAINLNPNNALYYSNLGVLYHRWRQPQKAIEMYKKSLQIDPDMKTAESNLRKLMNIQ